jgi:hypothetical protein
LFGPAQNGWKAKCRSSDPFLDDAPADCDQARVEAGPAMSPIQVPEMEKVQHLPREVNPTIPIHLLIAPLLVWFFLAVGGPECHASDG